MSTENDPISRALQRLNASEVDVEVATVIENALGGVRGATDAADDSTAGTQAYLKSVAISGFRGIGPEAKLDIEPGPGLTLVVGRNGSGKSSFADGLEFLLTGDAMRWSNRAADWKKGWRNLHNAAKTSVSAQFLVNDKPNPLTLHHEWGAEDDLDGGSGWAQAHGTPQVPLADFGWLAATESARPFLSYSELGDLLQQGPSKMYDAMSKILGLDTLVTAAENLRQERLAKQKQVKETKAELKDRILPGLQRSDDPRAVRCAGALGGKVWDLETVLEIVGGNLGADAGAEVRLLRSTAALPASSVGEVERLAVEARGAIDARTSLSGTNVDRSAAIADLLKRAVAFHTDHAEPNCPVCGTAGVIDDAWREQASASVIDLETEARAVREADRRVNDTFAEFRSAVAPATIDTAGLRAVDIDATLVAEAIETLTNALDTLDDEAMLTSTTVAYANYADELTKLQALALAEADRRDDVWRPLALELSSWLTPAGEAQAAEVSIGNLQKAEKWITEIAGEIRQEHFEPIATRAQSVWSQLSLHSNVELHNLILSGAASSRKLTIDVSVDGVEGVALGVMSQGELHGLALSLFLPRATRDESPFRFVVIDDPVQAMDPSRVDGLARVLAEVATDRQVVVFTHDDRLPEAVRRLQIATTVLEVTRRPGSIVNIRRSLDPMEQALNDARALARSDGLPVAARERLVPGLCRTALEAAAIETVRRRRLGAGMTHAEVEEAFGECTKLTHFISLALFDDLDRGGDVLHELNKHGRWAGDVFQTCNKGIHGGYRGNLAELVNQTASLAGRIRTIK